LDGRLDELPLFLEDANTSLSFKSDPGETDKVAETEDENIIIEAGRNDCRLQ
jgi:hypothetical protein